MQFLAPFSALLHYLKQLSPDAVQYRIHGKDTIKVSSCVMLTSDTVLGGGAGSMQRKQ